MKISSACLTGKNNQRKGWEAQDCVKILNTPYVSSIAIADGASSAEHSREGAVVNVETWTNFVQKSYPWEFQSEDNFREHTTLLNEINAQFEKMPYEKPHLSATLAGVAVRNDNRVLITSIGDGFVIGFDRNLDPNILIYPYHIGKTTRTCFTCQPAEAQKTMQLLIGTTHDCLRMADEVITGFAVFSDGADYLVEHLLHGGELLRQLAAYTVSGQQDFASRLVRMISENYSYDDISIACMMMESNDVLELSKTIIEEAEKNSSVSLDAEAAAPVQAEPDFSEVYPFYRPVLQGLYLKPMTHEELEENGYCLPGKVMEMLLPLMQNEIVEFRDNQFRLSDKFAPSET